MILQKKYNFLTIIYILNIFDEIIITKISRQKRRYC